MIRALRHAGPCTPSSVGRSGSAWPRVEGRLQPVLHRRRGLVISTVALIEALHGRPALADSSSIVSAESAGVADAPPAARTAATSPRISPSHPADAQANAEHSFDGGRLLVAITPGLEVALGEIKLGGGIYPGGPGAGVDGTSQALDAGAAAAAVEAHLGWRFSTRLYAGLAVSLTGYPRLGGGNGPGPASSVGLSAELGSLPTRGLSYRVGLGWRFFEAQSLIVFDTGDPGWEDNRFASLDGPDGHVSVAYAFTIWGDLTLGPELRAGLSWLRGGHYELQYGVYCEKTPSYCQTSRFDATLESVMPTVSLGAALSWTHW